MANNLRLRFTFRCDLARVINLICIVLYCIVYVLVYGCSFVSFVCMLLHIMSVCMFVCMCGLRASAVVCHQTVLLKDYIAVLIWAKLRVI